MRFLFFFFPFLLFADKVVLQKATSDEVDQPWLTGPLLAPTAIVVPGGHVNFEPYLYVIANTGNYNGNWAVQKTETLWSNSQQSVVQIGITSWMDVQISPTVAYNYTCHAAKWVFGDFPFELDFQLYAPLNVDDWMPFVKLSLTEIFPTGDYQNLDPHKKGTDIGGFGSFNTQIGLVFGKQIHFTGLFFMTARLFVEYALPSPVHLQGFNTYGGGFGTNVRFFPAQTFLTDLGLEFTLSENWAFACDFVGTWTGKTHFKGDPGRDLDGKMASLGNGSSVQYAIAPAIEYNWSANLGIIFGSWFTLAGRNTVQFYSGVFAFNYYL